MLVDATAHMLTETPADTLDSHRNVNAALTEYRSARASMTNHIDYMSGYAGGRKFTAIERLLISAATHDHDESPKVLLVRFPVDTGRTVSLDSLGRAGSTKTSQAPSAS